MSDKTKCEYLHFIKGLQTLERTIGDAGGQMSYDAFCKLSVPELIVLLEKNNITYKAR